MAPRAAIPVMLLAARRSVMNRRAGQGPQPLGRKRIRWQGDFQLPVRQLNGKYPVKDQKLKILYLRAQTLLRQFDSYRMVHVYREMNKVADRLVNRGIDNAMGETARAKVD